MTALTVKRKAKNRKKKKSLALLTDGTDGFAFGSEQYKAKYVAVAALGAGPCSG